MPSARSETIQGVQTVQLMDKLRLEIDAMLNAHFRRVDTAMGAQAKQVETMAALFEQKLDSSQEKAAAAHERLASQMLAETRTLSNAVMIAGQGEILDNRVLDTAIEGYAPDLVVEPQKEAKEVKFTDCRSRQQSSRSKSSIGTGNSGTQSPLGSWDLSGESPGLELPAEFLNKGGNGSGVLELTDPTSKQAEQEMTSSQKVSIRKRVSGSASSCLTDEERAKVLKEMGLLAQLVMSQRFEQGCALAILANSIFIGCQAEVLSHYPDNPFSSEFLIISYLFTVYFTLELILRAAVFGLRDFFIDSDQKGWNIFDCLVVCTALFEAVVGLFLANSPREAESISILRMLRIIRILRLMRIIRVFRFFRELRMMVTSIVGCVKSLMWAVVLLLVMLYMFGVFFTQGVTSYCIEHDKCASAEFEKHLSFYGSVPRSIYTLYKAMSGGVDWGDPAEPLSDVGGIYVLFYIFFITFATIAIMNIVTGVFVEVAMTAAQSDRDAMIQDKAFKKEMYVKSMQDIFHEIDDDGDGIVTLDELERNIKDPRLKVYLEALDLDVSDITTLHRLCDLDGEGNVDIDDFVSGCSRVKGEASAMDVAMMKYALNCELISLRELVELRFTELRVRGPKSEEPRSKRMKSPTFAKVRVTGEARALQIPACALRNSARQALPRRCVEHYSAASPPLLSRARPSLHAGDPCECACAFCLAAVVGCATASSYLANGWTTCFRMHIFGITSAKSAQDEEEGLIPK